MFTQSSKVFSHSTVFITGASSGIGQALARYYAANGAQLGLVARRLDVLAALKAELNVESAIYSADVRDAAALKTAADSFIAQYGVPDIVIACAGVSSGTQSQNAEDAAIFKAVMDINVLGLVHTFQPFIAGMQANKRGQLVGIASVAGIRGLPGAGAYSASKAAAITYLESLRIEMAADNIAVTTIAPGFIRTPMTDINTYKMPFLMDADVAAEKFAKAIKNKRRFVVIPWQMGMVARFMRFIPPFLWDFAMKNAPKKARMNWDWL